MASEEQSEERGFKVVDRRSGGGSEAPADADATPDPAEHGLPKVDFSSFCLSLGTSALYHLGMVGDPQTGEAAAEPNFELARQTIDALEMLSEKTRGNLDTEEKRLLDGLLYELHSGYVEAAKRKKTSAAE